jgi:hypothetical protein
LADAAVGAFETYVADVQSGAFPGPEQTYKPLGLAESRPYLVNEEEAPALDAPLALDLWH